VVGLGIEAADLPCLDQRVEQHRARAADTEPNAVDYPMWRERDCALFGEEAPSRQREAARQARSIIDREPARAGECTDADG
jgi:hypothetical protein